MLKRYNEFINEGLRSKLKANSAETIRQNLSQMGILDWVKEVKKLKLDDSYLPPSDDIKQKLSQMNTIDRFIEVKNLKLSDEYTPDVNNELKKLSDMDIIELYKKSKTTYFIDYLCDKNSVKKYPIDLNEVIRQYIYAALWSNELDEYDADDIINDENIGLDIEKIKAEINTFVRLSGNALSILKLDEESIGMDLWLTRNGHGAGFWDRGYGELGDELSEFAKLLGEDYYLEDIMNSIKDEN